jgi:two-component system C4-dicarboxylate transport response regulator DctD
MKRSILIIDDDPALLEALTAMIRFRLADVHLHTAAIPEDALRLMATREYDVILSDIRLPGMDGLTLLRRIRVLRPAVPVIMMTGHGSDAVRQAAMDAGAVSFLQKPFDRDELVQHLRAALFGRQTDPVPSTDIRTS